MRYFHIEASKITSVIAIDSFLANKIVMDDVVSWVPNLELTFDDIIGLMMNIITSKDHI